MQTARSHARKFSYVGTIDFHFGQRQDLFVYTDSNRRGFDINGVIILVKSKFDRFGTILSYRLDGYRFTSKIQNFHDGSIQSFLATIVAVHDANPMNRRHHFEIYLPPINLVFAGIPRVSTTKNVAVNGIFGWPKSRGLFGGFVKG